MTTVPLDPDSPAGIATADRLSQALAEIMFAMWERGVLPQKPRSPRRADKVPATT